MPLSFRRSYKKLPAADLNRNKRRIAKIPSKKIAVEIPAEFRPRRYPAIIPAGCGIAVGACLFVLISQGFVQLPAIPAPPRANVARNPASAAQATQTRQPSAAAVPDLTATTAPMATRTSSPIPAEAALAANPWAADVPDAACIPPDLPQTGRVVEVLDGETIKVLLDSDGRVYSVRYLGIEAPALNQGAAGLGQVALARNSELVYRKQAVMVRDITDSDANGTLLRYVLAEGVFVNHALIQGGLAEVGMAAPDLACLQTLLSAQQHAQTQMLGIWIARPTPTPGP